MSNLVDITLYTQKFKTRGLIRYAFKYCAWALQEQGTLLIKDNGPRSFAARPYSMPFSVVAQQAHKLLYENMSVVTSDKKACQIRFVRNKPSGAVTWSAGIVFSGAASEVTSLTKCIQGLSLQPELSPLAGGEIIVCGPSNAEHLVADFKNIRYLPYDLPEGERAFTTRKKNYIARHALGDRVIIMHTRIILQDGCIQNLPQEFDVITPRVIYRYGNVTLPYHDWIVSDCLDGERMPRKIRAPFDYDRNKYLDLLRTGMVPYIDGGLFIARKAVLLHTPLNEAIAWGEAEDTEWCARLHANGYLVDLEPSSLALSQTCKYPKYFIKHSKFTALTSPVRRWIRWGWGWLKYQWIL